MNTLNGYSKSTLSDLFTLTASGGHFPIHSGRNNEKNKLVRTDASGYILAGWINTLSGDMGTTAATKIYCSNDAYIRYKTLANFSSDIAGQLYWANIKVSTSSNVATNPTFNSVIATDRIKAVNYVFLNPNGDGIYLNNNSLNWHTNSSWKKNLISFTSDGNVSINYNVGIGTASPSYKLHVVGDVFTTTGFKKSGSSDSYVLLGGGGHKAVSDFASLNHNHNKILGPDARSSNNNPLWYMSNRGSGSVTSEFSSQGTSVLGRTYTNLTTFTPWRDSSGDYPVLLAFNLTGMAMRTSASTNAWNGWPSGNIYAGNFYTASDIRYKKILSNIKVSVKQLAKIPLFNFTWTDVNDNMMHSGTSALKVKKFLPYIVTGSDKLTLDYATLGTIAGITACKELVTLKSEIEILKDRIELLEQQLKMYHGNSK